MHAGTGVVMAMGSSYKASVIHYYSGTISVYPNETTQTMHVYF